MRAQILVREKKARARSDLQRRKKGAMPEKWHRTSLRIYASFPITKQKSRTTAATYFRQELKFCLSHLRIKKICRKLFRCASACARMFLAVIACSPVFDQILLHTFVCAWAKAIFSCLHAVPSIIIPRLFQRTYLSALTQILLCWRAVLLVYQFLILSSSDAHVILKNFQRVFICA